MTPTLAIAIMHAPWDAWRRGHVVRMQRALRPARVLVVEDAERKGPWWTARAAWKALARTSASHVCLLQDDMDPVRNFGPGLCRAIAARPNHFISPFTMRGKEVEETLARGAAWYRTVDSVYGNAGVMPRSWVLHLIAWSDRWTRDDYVHDDPRTGLFLKVHQQEIWQMVPCVVQHAQTHSLLAHARGRQARLVADDALAIDWTAGLDGRPLLKQSPVGSLKEAWERARRVPVDVASTDSGWRPVAAS